MSGKRTDYISWDEYFMGVATLSGMRSKDPNTQVGACIVSEEHKILSMGYNGFPTGCSDDDFPWAREGEPLENKYFYTTHSELNAILNYRGGSLEGATMYVTLFPCNECAKAIIQAGIKRLVYDSDKYNGTPSTIASRKMLSAAGVDIQKYELDNLILWDTPGLGDGKEADNRHARNIIDKLAEVDKDGNAVIDLVLVILDGGTRDLGTSYELINEVIIPNLGENKSERILVAINQADMAMKGRYWDYGKNEPMSELKEFLDKKVVSVRSRIKETTGVEVNPIYYSAGYKEEGMIQSAPYNLSKLLYYIVKATPKEKRVVFCNNINRDQEVWKSDDKLMDYNRETKKSIIESVRDGMETGGDIGEMIAGKPGKVVGTIIGAVGGFLGGIIGGIFG